MCAGLIFRPAERDLGYALTMGNQIGVPIIRAILMAVQAHILRALLFEVRVARFYRPKYDTLKPFHYKMIYNLNLKNRPAAH